MFLRQHWEKIKLNIPMHFWIGAEYSGLLKKKKRRNVHRKMGAFLSIMWRLLVLLCILLYGTIPWTRRCGQYISWRIRSMVFINVSCARTIIVQFYWNVMTVVLVSREPNTSTFNFFNYPLGWFEGSDSLVLSYIRIIGKFFRKPLQGYLFCKFRDVIINLNN